MLLSVSELNAVIRYLNVFYLCLEVVLVVGVLFVAAPVVGDVAGLVTVVMVLCRVPQYSHRVYQVFKLCPSSICSLIEEMQKDMKCDLLCKLCQWIETLIQTAQIITKRHQIKV